jgi:hypothetical protein
MNKRLKAFLPAAAICALLAYNPAAAQDAAAEGTATEAAASAEDGSAFDEFAAEHEASEAGSGAAEVTVSVTPPPAKSAAPVAPAQVREPRGASEGLWFSFGWRWGLGLSSFSGHRPVPVNNPDINVPLKPALSGSVAVALAATSLIHVEAISTDLSVTLDAQITGYSAYGSSKSVDQKAMNATGQTKVQYNDAIAGLVALEFPLLARLDNIAGRAAGPLYIECGPQFGWNGYARHAVRGEGVFSSRRNGFAFGPAVGAGLNFGDALLGVRAYYDALQYSDYVGGRPWTVQAGLTKYFWDY